MCWLGQILCTRVQLEVGSLRPAGREGVAAPGAQTVTSYPVSQYGQQAHRNLTGETKCFNLIFNKLSGSILPQFELLYIGARLWWHHFLLQSNKKWHHHVLLICVQMSGSHLLQKVGCPLSYLPFPPPFFLLSSFPLLPSHCLFFHVPSLWLCTYQTASLAPVVADTMETHRARHFAACTHKNRKETCWYLTQDHIPLLPPFLCTLAISIYMYITRTRVAPITGLSRDRILSLGEKLYNAQSRGGQVCWGEGSFPPPQHTH